MKFSVLFLPSIGPRGTKNDPETYSKLVDDMRETAVLLDDLGYEAMFLTEHHFGTEGHEVCTNPLMWAVDLAARTSRLKFGSLGMQAASWHPLRLAEDIAVVDHLTKGRFVAGLSRGYVSRENRVLGPGSGVATSDGSATDQRNWRYFAEFIDVMRTAWTNDVFSYDGEFFQFPPKGIPWDHPATTKGVKDGMISEIGLVPRPYTTPHPPLWQVVSSSEATMRLAARHQESPVLMLQSVEPAKRLFNAYREEAEAHGLNAALGERTVLVRDTYVADTLEEARHDFVTNMDHLWLGWLAPFGFINAMAAEGEESVPNDMSTVMERAGVVGDPETVAERIQEFRDELNLSHYVVFAHNLVSPEKLRRSLTLFAEKVMPRFQS